MRRALFLALLPLAFAAASADDGASYRIDGRLVTFTRLERDRLLVSRECLVASVCACQACAAAEKSDGPTPPGADDRNPGAVACRAVGGLSLVGLDARGNERGFCRFRDGSLVSNGSLYAKLRRR
jgi:hypothetical protein